MSAERRITSSWIGASLLALAVGGFAMSASPASAQGLFQSLFGSFRRAIPSSASPYANPLALFGNTAVDPQPTPAGPAVSYCVRTCDGRYFPIQRQANPAQTCTSFCPASATTVLYGSSIDGARASNGVRYADLDNAYLYREKVVSGCTCNGRDPFGLAKMDVDQDATLRPGDIVATKEGLMAYRGINRTTNGPQYTPVSNYSALSEDVRRKLAAMKIDPGQDEASSAIAQASPVEASAARHPTRHPAKRRTQASR